MHTRDLHSMLRDILVVGKHVLAASVYVII